MCTQNITIFARIHMITEDRKRRPTPSTVWKMQLQITERPIRMTVIKKEKTCFGNSVDSGILTSCWRQYKTVQTLQQAASLLFSPIQPNNFAPRNVPETEKTNVHTDTCHEHSSSKVGATQMSLPWRMNNYSVLSPYSGMLFSTKQGWRSYDSSTILGNSGAAQIPKAMGGKGGGGEIIPTRYTVIARGNKPWDVPESFRWVRCAGAQSRPWQVCTSTSSHLELGCKHYKSTFRIESLVSPALANGQLMWPRMGKHACAFLAPASHLQALLPVESPVVPPSWLQEDGPTLELVPDCVTTQRSDHQCSRQVTQVKS